MEFTKDGKWYCRDCNKEMDKEEYVSLDCCGPCYHERIWRNNTED